MSRSEKNLELNLGSWNTKELVDGDPSLRLPSPSLPLQLDSFGHSHTCTSPREGREGREGGETVTVRKQNTNRGPQT